MVAMAFTYKLCECLHTTDLLTASVLCKVDEYCLPCSIMYRQRPDCVLKGPFSLQSRELLWSRKFTCPFRENMRWLKLIWSPTEHRDPPSVSSHPTVQCQKVGTALQLLGSFWGSCKSVPRPAPPIMDRYLQGTDVSAADCCNCSAYRGIWVSVPKASMSICRGTVDLSFFSQLESKLGRPYRRQGDTVTEL